jgi:hypothetical protein
VEVEDLGHEGGLVGDGLERDAALVGVAAVAVGHGLELAAVAVGGDAAHAVALLGALAHSAFGLAGELVALELVPQLLHPDEHLPLGCVGVAGAHGVVDRDADLAQLALEQRGVEAVAGETAGGVHDHRVEASCLAVACLGREGGPAWAVLLRA